MTQRRVNVGSGTLYNLLEQFVTAGMIRETKVEPLQFSNIDNSCCYYILDNRECQQKLFYHFGAWTQKVGEESK